MAGIVYACINEHELLDQDDGQLTVSEAQQWYESNKNETLELRGSTNKKRTLVRPNWEHSSSKRDKDYETVETTLTSDHFFNFTDEACSEKYDETKDEHYLLSKTQLVVRKNAKTKETEGFLMTVVPDLEYLESTHFEPFKKISYLERDKKFSGYIFYHDMDGNFVNGWRYKKGVAYTMMLDEDSSDSNIQLRSITCESIILEYNTWECYPYIGWESGQWVAGPACRKSTNYMFLVYCDQGSSGGGNGVYLGGGSGGSGGGGGTAPSTNTSNIADNIGLNSDGIKKLNEILEKMLNECGYLSVYNYLTGNNVKFSSVSIDPSIAVGRFNSTTGALTFSSNNRITEAFPEEFIHLFQHNYYMGGIDQYGTTNPHYYNVEFEAKLMQDIINHIAAEQGRSVGGVSYGDGPQFGQNNDIYFFWLDYLTSEGTSLPDYTKLMSPFVDDSGNSYSYSDFLSDWAIRYGGVPVDTSFNPQFTGIFNNANCP